MKLINTYGDRLAIPDESYFLTLDASAYPEYNRIVNAYVLLFLRVQDAVSGNRSEQVKSEGRQSVAIILSGVGFAKTFLDRYIVRAYISEKNITLYRTKNPLLAKPLGALENKIIGKFNALLESDTITRTEYDASVQAYDDFVLHLMMYRDYGKSTLSKDRALAAAKIFLTTYRKQMEERSAVSIDPSLEQERQIYLQQQNVTSPSSRTIGDVYTFPETLVFGETSEGVRNLQAVLKSYGYFGSLNPTGYFGNSTREYLVQFSREVLAIDNPNGLFSTKIRTAILALQAR